MTITLPVTQNTGDLIEATDYNAIVNAALHLLSMYADGATLDQAAAGITLGYDIGDYKFAARRADIGNRWLRCDGRTIGAASSGATARANADTEALFSHLWSNFDNAELTIQDNGGSPSVRGATAAADFAGGMRMPLPDLRGRAMVMLDDPTGAAAADRITFTWADALGGAGGTDQYTLQPGNMAVNALRNATGFTLAFGADFSVEVVGTNSAFSLMQPSYAGGVWLIYTGN